jgi:sugar phosphate isomerase/epimerase
LAGVPPAEQSDGAHRDTSFGGPADDPARHKEIEKNAREACQFLKTFGATELVVFSPARVNKVLVREHLRIACDFYNHLGDVAAEYGIRAGLHNHSQGQLVESQDEVELFLKLTDPKRFHWAPDTIHLYLGGCGICRAVRKIRGAADLYGFRRQQVYLRPAGCAPAQRPDPQGGVAGRHPSAVQL